SGRPADGSWQPDRQIYNGGEIVSSMNQVYCQFPIADCRIKLEIGNRKSTIPHPCLRPGTSPRGVPGRPALRKLRAAASSFRSPALTTTIGLPPLLRNIPEQGCNR